MSTERPRPILENTSIKHAWLDIETRFIYLVDYTSFRPEIFIEEEPYFGSSFP